jgi:hypothetical protein
LIPAYSGSGRLQINAIQAAGDGSLSTLATISLPRGSWNVRTLPLDDHRFAVVSKGRIVEIVDSADL